MRFVSVLLLASAALWAADKEILLDAKTRGRVFEGIGALSAGASSKPPIDYPEPQRSQILALLFTPKYGASLQHLKVEIGGDVNSTCGTEPAFAHRREEFAKPDPSYYRRGYEWWLMVEAKKRSPVILFDALQWGAPGWIGDGQFYSQDNADLITAFHRPLASIPVLKPRIKGPRGVKGMRIARREESQHILSSRWAIPEPANRL